MKTILLLAVIFISLTSHAQLTKNTELFTYTNGNSEELTVQFLALTTLPTPVYSKIVRTSLDSTAGKLVDPKTLEPRQVVITEVDSWFISTVLYNNKSRAQYAFDLSGSYLFNIKSYK